MFPRTTYCLRQDTEDPGRKNPVKRPGDWKIKAYAKDNDSQGKTVWNNLGKNREQNRAEGRLQ